MSKRLLALRKKISDKRPAFIQTDSNKRVEVNDAWRKPRGSTNKVRRQFWGKPAMVKPGYRGPKAVRGLHNSGLQIVLVNSPGELDSIDPKTQGIILGSIGNKKKSVVLSACKEKGITVLNVKNVDESIKAIADKLVARKESKKDLAKKKAEKKKKIKPRKEKETPMTREEEREEMERIVTSG